MTTTDTTKVATETSTASADQPVMSDEAVSTTRTLSPADMTDDHFDEANRIQNIIEDLKHSPLTFYGATPNLASRAEFFMAGASGDVAIVKNTGQNVQEFLLSGLFEIARQNFFMGAEGGYMPSNLFNRDFVDTKLTCHLTPVQRFPEFAFARDDFNLIINNIKALEKLIPQRRGETTSSCLRDLNGQSTIRLSHSLFMVCFTLNGYITTNTWIEKR